MWFVNCSSCLGRDYRRTFFYLWGLGHSSEGGGWGKSQGSPRGVFYLSGTSSTSSRLRGMEETEWNPSDASRAREKEQSATHSCPYIRRDSWRRPSELLGPGEPGSCSASPPSSSLGAVDTSLLWGTQGLSSSSSRQSGLVLQGEELVWMPSGEFGLWVCNPPEGQLDWGGRGCLHGSPGSR